MLRQFRPFAFVKSGLRFMSIAPDAAQQSQSTKEAMQTLRKRTGYSYLNCRKAITEFGVNRLGEAEKWLHEMAVKEGWKKASKLSDRKAVNGFVSVAIDGNKGVLIEINCETDFVSRGEYFQEFVGDVTISALNYVQSIRHENKQDKLISTEIELDKLYCEKKSTRISELLARVIGKIGENIVIRRIHAVTADPNVVLSGYTHPKVTCGAVHMGKFASFAAVKQLSPSDIPIETVGDQICQHIVGMRPVDLGAPPEIKAEQTQEASNDDSEEDNSDDILFDAKDVQIDENETSLLRQSFMLCPSVSVYEYCASRGATIIDFIRTEVGDKQK